MRERPFQPCVYIMASKRNGTLYIGVTSDIVRRVWEHREGLGSTFVRKYGVTRLVWFEMHAEMGGAIQREKRLKAWKRAWKLRLIETDNPGWNNLWDTLH